MRRRVFGVAGMVSAVAISGCGGGSHHIISTTTSSPSSETSMTFGATTTTILPTNTIAASGVPVILNGNGVASVRFGLSVLAATNGLDAVLGNPKGSPIDMSGNCDIDTALQWSTLTGYFDRGTFVGYGTWAANEEPVTPGNMETAMGLRIGDTITQAENLYGTVFRTTTSQGGSWSVSTPQGKLIGNLSAVPGQPGPDPTISSIAAGSVGCPAATP